MLIRGLDYLPPVEFDFGDLLNAVVLADDEVVPDDDSTTASLLIERFARAASSRPPTGSTDVLDGGVPPHYSGSTSPALRSDRRRGVPLPLAEPRALGV